MDKYCKFCNCQYETTYFEHAIDNKIHRDLLIKNYDEIIKNQYSKKKDLRNNF